MSAKRFQYPLEAVRTLRNWECEKALLALTRRQRELAAARKHVAQLEHAHDAACAAATRAWATFRDPAAYARLLHALAAGRTLIIEAAQAASLAEQAVAAAQSAVDQARLRVESIEQHREGEFRAHRGAQARSDALRADEAWILRQPIATGSRT